MPNTSDEIVQLFIELGATKMLLGAMIWAFLEEDPDRVGNRLSRFRETVKDGPDPGEVPAFGGISGEQLRARIGRRAVAILDDIAGQSSAGGEDG